MRKLSLCLLIFLSFPAGAALAESSYVGMIPVDNQKLQAVNRSKESSSFRPISSWVGERFIFLPKQMALQRFGYPNFQIGDELYKPPSYSEYVGRIAKVVSLQEVCNHWDVELEMEDNGQRVSASARSGGIDGVAPVADIEDARDRWLGKTLWYKKTWLERYNEDTGEVYSVHIRKNSQVKVIDIRAGWKHATPVRFILQTGTGKEGYVDMAWSGTNCYDYDRRYCDTFETSFFTQDPAKSSKSAKDCEPENLHHLQRTMYVPAARQGG
jgi:hypothetical protein